MSSCCSASEYSFLPRHHRPRRPSSTRTMTPATRSLRSGGLSRLPSVYPGALSARGRVKDPRISAATRDSPAEASTCRRFRRADGLQIKAFSAHAQKEVRLVEALTCRLAGRGDAYVAEAIFLPDDADVVMRDSTNDHLISLTLIPNIHGPTHVTHSSVNLVSTRTTTFATSITSGRRSSSSGSPFRVLRELRLPGRHVAAPTLRLPIEQGSTQEEYHWRAPIESVSRPLASR